LKIVHVCLCDAYKEDWEYHRNLASEYDVEHGNSVYIISSSLSTDQNANWVFGESKKFDTSSGIHVYQLKNLFNKSLLLQSKTNGVIGIYKTLECIKPDIIMVHNLQTLSLYEITKYKRAHPWVVLCGDTHADFYNSARNFWSKKILNNIIYKKIINDNIKYFNKFFFHGVDTREFYEKMYSLSIPNAELSSIGAKVLDYQTLIEERRKLRKFLGWDESKLYLLHSGKMNARKKTKDILLALSKIKSSNIELNIIGNFTEDQEKLLLPMIEADPRVHFLGWKTAKELKKYLCISDLYLQPGTMSITLLNSLSVGTPAVIYPYKDYEQYFNGWEYLAKNSTEIQNRIEEALNDREDLLRRRVCAYNIAKEKIDISLFSSKLYNVKSSDKLVIKKLK